ncbi:LacI family transcriptional regulator [Maricaulis sp. W15]|uniref:LacI family DNA-binding transcriptional regulator n=1 Tax=Maricaulis sp. W15 TaxID=1772333 RepID=UPI000948E9C6|nr:LacI family DNA-binding transcriptional regulator [Maricaulis sp. W15]OLF81632.1 LacI family transcriptional regulator [Maricaulis sp. W15]
MARMIDVANKAGVSIKTVSRVLNNEPHVKESLRDKVRTAAAEVGYVPSTTARALRSRRSYAIHLVSHSHRSAYVNAIQFGAVQTCQQRGYQLMVSLMEDLRDMPEADLVARFERLMAASKPDGLILVPPLSNDERLYGVLERFDVPVARVGPNNLPDARIIVKINEREAARELTEHLISLGHTRIAFVRGKEDQNATHERFAGYRDALDGAGIALDEALVQPGDFNFPTGLEAGDALFALANRPTAVFAANDDMAAGVLMSAHRLRIDVPDDLSVVGFDDSEIAEKMWPALTTVRQPLLTMGNEATRQLIDAATNQLPGMQDVPNEYLDYEIIHRDSTGPAPRN